jgi:CelD/BcsL family acetyltransferase involved in cellulose biosynthesis
LITHAVAGQEPPAEVAVRADIRVECISDFEAFLELEPVWNELVSAIRPDHPFFEYDWVKTWWECFGAGSSLQILVLKAGDRPIAIAPLILTPLRWSGVRVRRLGFLYNAHVPRADFLIAERHAEVYQAIWNYISHKGGWDLLQLCQLVEGSATLDATSRLAEATGCPTGVWPSDVSPYTPLAQSWAEYFNGLTAKHRSNLRNRFKRLGAVGEVEVETVASAADMEDAMEAGLTLEAAAWKGKARTAISSDEKVSRFYSMLATRAARHGWMRLHFLRAGHVRVAFDYSLCYGNKMHLLKLGYDPAYAPFSPSNLLLCKVLEGAFEEGLSEYDLLGANVEWKRSWTNQARPYYWLFVFAPGFKGRLLHLVKFRLLPLLDRGRLRPLREWLLCMNAKRKS